MLFISYAQNYEDVTLWRALHAVEKGFYVDVGAADPEEWSVTRAFYDRGWSGINVEPLDDYFDKLKQTRPRDTNLKVAAGRESGARTLHAFAGTGLSTFDARIAARHQADGWKSCDTVVPVLPLAKILEDCAPPIIHFLKIDVEGAELEVLEGLNLGRTRPWIILIEATEPFSTISTREKWEHVVAGQGYEFAYFDGVNCFYVATEVSRLKEKLAVPPNVFDDFVRRPEFLTRERVSVLEQQLAGLRDQAHGLEQSIRERTQEITGLQSELEKERTHTADLERTRQTELEKEWTRAADLEQTLQADLEKERTRAAGLERTLQAELEKERARTASLEHALRAEQAEKFQARQRNQELERELATPAMVRALRSIREKGDRITGGGLRSLTKRTFQKTVRRAMQQPQILAVARKILRPFPKLATTLYKVATKVEEVPIALPVKSLPSDKSAVEEMAATLRAKSLPPDESATLQLLPASARKTYRTLRSLILEAEVTRRTK
jgi:FkbM family methyltransferase